MPYNVLDIFDPVTTNWFSQTLGKPTAVQEAAWPAIAAGEHTLVSAPTGTGKTLSAFLVFIDQLAKQARSGTLKSELHVIYISPLKSLAADIRENLRRPVKGISAEEQLHIAIRTGDTPQSERRKMIKHPPHILITTPESLYLMLTSVTGRSILCTARTIILDELHALIDSKRGAHLMLSVARLDQICPNPLQRIGLSATIRPLSLAAEYLSPEPVTIAAPKMEKTIQLSIENPFSGSRKFIKDPVWQEIASAVYSHCIGKHSVIAFVEGRAYAEKLAYHVNQLGEGGFARTHHGSLSKEQRLEVENSLRNGELRLLCATSSMELGIDVGDIDQVIQVGCPRSISSTMQRLGRAGHNPNRTSVMYFYPRTVSEGLFCAMTAKVVRDGGIERSKPPTLCFDVLAQHLVSMATGDGYHLDEVMEILPRAYPFRKVTKEDVRDVLCMLAGDYEHERDIPVRPRILYDRIHDRVEGDPYSRMLAISTGGTIPDRGMFDLKTENGVKIGELEEEFVFEIRKGDRFLFGTFSWQVSQIQKDVVIVKQTHTENARMPFWKGDNKGRGLQTGLAFGAILRMLANAHENDALLQALLELNLEENLAQDVKDFIERQLNATGFLPDDKTIVIEHFKDGVGDDQMMVHSIFGRQVNAPLAILAREAAKKRTRQDIQSVDEECGFLLYSYGGRALPEKLLYEIPPESARPILEAALPATSLFNMTFRYNAGRALMMGVRKASRQPLWIQRMRGADMLEALVRNENHPLMRETKRECLEDFWDLSGVEYVLKGIQSGSIQIYETFHHTPSPMSLPLQWAMEADMMYNYAPTTSGIHHAVEEALKQTQMITPDSEQLTQISERKHLPNNEKQLHSLLMIEGDLMAGELDVPVEWLESLAKQDRANYIEPGLWIAAEHQEDYENAYSNDSNLEANMHIVRRLLRYRGAKSQEQIEERYCWPNSLVHEILANLCKQESILEEDGLYYHMELYKKARQATILNRRRQIRTLPPERYAALLTNRPFITASPDEQLSKTILSLCDQPYPPAYWETVLLPGRVKGYRPAMLDAMLAQGEIFWRMSPNQELGFHRYEDIDWDSDIAHIGNDLEGYERIVFEALLKRGASFMQVFTPLLDGNSPYDAFMSLTGKGFVYADSFTPIRQWLNQEKINKATTRQRIQAKVAALSAGRWELSRPLIELSMERQLERLFDRMLVLCRETAQGIPWGMALETLRIWEYTGYVRRGYFIEGLSGAQFIRDEDFVGTTLSLEQPDERILWMPAIDPAQPWGKILPHDPSKSFINLPGTVVAVRAGSPIAVLEQQGKILRVFNKDYLAEALRIFVQDYEKRQLFPSLNRITIKQYPKEAVDTLSGVGFSKEMMDFVLYRKSF